MNTKLERVNYQLDKSVTLIAPFVGLEKGGVQTWAYYIDKALFLKNINVKSFSLRGLTISSLFSLFSRNFTSNIFILLSWKMFVSIFPAIIFSRFFSKRIIIVIHGDEILNQPFFYRLIINALIRMKNVRLIANSVDTSTRFYEAFSYKVDSVFNPFIDTNTPSFNANHLDDNHTPNRFFTITRLVRRKNILNVLKALDLLQKEGLNFQYYIAGDGPERKVLEAFVSSSNLIDCVFFLGKISEEEKLAHLEQSSLFLLPAIYDAENGSIEGYGIVYIEANMYGTPVISGDVGGAREAVIDGVTGLKCNGTVLQIHRTIFKALDTTFDKEKIVKFAKKHDYRKQNNFIKFVLRD